MSFQTNHAICHLPSGILFPPRIVSATSCYTSALLVKILAPPKMWEQWLGSMLIALASRIWIRCWRLGWGFWVKEDFPPKMWWWIFFWKGVLASKKCPETFRLRNCRWVFPERLEWRKLGGCEVHLSWECLLGTFREAFFAYIKFSMHSCPSAMFHEWLEKKNKKTKQHFPTKKKPQQAKFMVLAISIAQFSCFFFRSFSRLSLGFPTQGGAWTWTIPPAALAGHGKTSKGSEKRRSHRPGGVTKWGERNHQMFGETCEGWLICFFSQGLAVYTSCWGLIFT